MDSTSIFTFEISYSDRKKDIIINKNVITSANRTETLNNEKYKSIEALISEYEYNVICETMSEKMVFKASNNGSRPVIIISADHVRIEYHSYLSARLAIWSPPIEVEETDDYRMYKYGIKVNENWGIYLRTDGFGN
jgi:hypothetical protein